MQIMQTSSQDCCDPVPTLRFWSSNWPGLSTRVTPPNENWDPVKGARERFRWKLDLGSTQGDHVFTISRYRH